jgi:hypothetical protein
MILPRPVFATYLRKNTRKEYGRLAHEMCTCEYRPNGHLLVRLRKYMLLVRLSQLWDVADACFFRAHKVAMNEWIHSLLGASVFIHLFSVNLLQDMELVVSITAAYSIYIKKFVKNIYQYV